jgi:hypothetical protein
VVSVLLPLIVLAYFTLLNVALLATLRVGSPIFDALARADAKTLGGWLIVAVLVLLRLRRTAALAATAFLIWMAYSSSDGVNWSYFDAPSMLILAAAGLEVAALVASSGPVRAMQIVNWKHYALALAIPLGLAGIFDWLWLDHPAVSETIMITACGVTVAGMVLASPLSKRVVTLLALPVYYLIMELLVPPSMTGGPYESTSGWVGPWRITVTILPFAMLACVALAATLHAIRRTPAHGQEA